MRGVRVAEVFTSIQGESSFAGLPCFFIRLAGCNLRCRYCDTPAAAQRGTPRPIAGLVARWKKSRAAIAEITGGEPLLQAGFRELAAGLRDAGRRPVLVETNGSRDISTIPRGVIAIMDVKCPGSGERAALDPRNLGRLRPADEVKFVLADRADYLWARRFVRRSGVARAGRAVHFSPVGGRLDASKLARWILADGLPVRLHVQRHKCLGLK